MRCPVCGLEMLLYGKTVNEQGETMQSEYVCRNKRCVRFDIRLKKKTENTAAGAEQQKDN